MAPLLDHDQKLAGLSFEIDNYSLRRLRVLILLIVVTLNFQGRAMSRIALIAGNRESRTIFPWKVPAVLVLSLLLSACRIEVAVPLHGTVATESGSVFCESGQKCIVDVPDTYFDETFIAYPDLGYQFIGWTKGWRGLCGGNIQPCYLTTSGFSGHEALIAILESDETFYLEPNFLESDYIRSHQAGDIVEFEGTLESFVRGGTTTLSTVTVRREYAPFPFSGVDAQLLQITQTIKVPETGEAFVSTSSFWQEEDGTFVDFRDEDGNVYLTAATGDQGVQSIPAPAEPDGNSLIDYYIMFGGHTSGPITEGTRSIERFEMTALSQANDTYPAYRVLIADSYEYLFTYDEFKSGTRVTKESELWVSAAKGVVKSREVFQQFLSTGILERESILSLEFAKSNY